MTEELLRALKQITREERAILEGSGEIDPDIYITTNPEVFDSQKLMGDEKIICMRAHTRFVHFPPHRHNFIEFIYMCSGVTRHIVNGREVVLQPGELLFLNQSAVHEIFPAGLDDIGMNFFILPEFLEYGLNMIEAEENQLREFIMGCLRSSNHTPGYLHFKVADVLPAQNLIENLIWSLWENPLGKRNINQATMGLLFLELINCTHLLETDMQTEQKLMIDVLSYIEKNYREGQLSELADLLHYDFNWLSKEIKKRTGKNYTELLQNKRLGVAAYLLTTTSKSVMEIALDVGYDNISYFHRIFRKHYGTSPKKYRDGK